MGHLLVRGELAVGHVEEARVADERPQPLPGLDVRLIVGDVAIAEPVREWQRSIGRDRQDPQKLLEVGAVILAVAVADRGRRLAGGLVPVG